MDNGASSYRRFLNGDESGLNEIVEMYGNNLMFFINSIVKNITKEIFAYEIETKNSEFDTEK